MVKKENVFVMIQRGEIIHEGTLSELSDKSGLTIQTIKRYYSYAHHEKNRNNFSAKLVTRKDFVYDS